MGHIVYINIYSLLMEIVEIRFTKFKRFVAEEVSGTPMLSLFLNMPLGSFLQTLYVRSNEGMSCKDMAQKIMDYAGINPRHFLPEVLERFLLYIEYFTEVALKVCA